MRTKFKSLLVVVLAVTGFGLAAAPALAAPPANPLDVACQNGNTDAQSSSVCSAGNVTKDPAVNIINDAATIIALITGIGAVIMIIIGGFTMVTSGGNSEAVANARRRITYSLVALVVVALAWTITRFITDRLL